MTYELFLDDLNIFVTSLTIRVLIFCFVYNFLSGWLGLVDFCQ